MNHSSIKTALWHLYVAKWNVPQATKQAGLPDSPDGWELMKDLFRKYCKAAGST